ncbi:MAG: AAA family ATPase [Dehalococcoidia bacterium]
MPSERVQRRIERLLDTAEQAMDQSDWARARASVQEVLSLDPNNVDARTYLTAADGMLQETTVSAVSTAPDGNVSAAPGGRTEPEAERRQLTVMFCDLVDSTGLSTRLDPEELREVVRAYQQACAQVIEHYEGHIAQYLGDGLLVYFGYPAAHEDDALRAVRVAMEIVEAMQQLNSRLAEAHRGAAGVRLAVRIGIHTGLVVVGDMGGGARHEQLALGDTPILAARLQGLAEPDTVVISAHTQRLVQGMVSCRPLGPQTLKGFAEPLAVYRVLGESVLASRLDATETLTPLVGREQEMGLLLDCWRQARTGSLHVAILSGEPGIGKSRLVRVLRERLEGEPHLRVELRCSQISQHSALYPLIDHYQRLLQFAPKDAPEDRLDRLEAALREHGLPLQETVPLFATLLSLPLPGRYPPLSLSPERQKQKLYEASLTWLRAEAGRQPVLFVVEDLHWIDPSTLELLSLLVEQQADVAYPSAVYLPDGVHRAMGPARPFQRLVPQPAGTRPGKRDCPRRRRRQDPPSRGSGAGCGTDGRSASLCGRADADAAGVGVTRRARRAL